MRKPWPTLFITCMATIVVAWGWTGIQAQYVPLVHERGQSVVPVYEGYYTNPDGATVVSFGYLNRNFKEPVDIPIGPNNRFEPEPANRGQPTHFTPRRQTGLFTVTLPKDAAKTLTWTLISRGETFSIPANFDPLWLIDPLKDAVNGNTAPMLKFDPAGPSAMGIVGLRTELKTVMPNPVTLNVWVTDDGVMQETRVTPLTSPTMVRATWHKYSGPGTVTFSNSNPPIDKAHKATTSATFSAPGEYVLRVLAEDSGGSGAQCCWTNGYVKVSVGPSADQSGKER
jgi:hypothetical protein